MASKIRVVVLDTEQYCSDYPFGDPLTLPDAINVIRRLYESIPDQYRDKAVIEFGARGGYDGDMFSTVTVVYTRPETDEEMAKRTERERIEQDQRRSNDLQTLAALKKKYEA